MAEAAVTAENVTSDVTDGQVEQFFETSGEQSPEVETVVQEPEKKEPSELERIQVELRNIKGALGEERGRRKDEARKREQMEQRFQQLMERMSPPKETSIPDLGADPVGHFAAKTQQLEQQVKQQAETVQQAEQRRQYEAQVAQFDNAYRTQALQYAQETPEFNDAYTHLVTSRQQAYEQAGIDPSEYAQRLVMEERQVAQTAFMLGINPGVLIHQLAQASGFKPKGQTQVKQQPNLETIAKGSQAKSLSGVAGSPKQNLTLEALAEMDDKDFEANWDKLVKG